MSNHKKRQTTALRKRGQDVTGQVEEKDTYQIERALVAAMAGFYTRTTPQSDGSYVHEFSTTPFVVDSTARNVPE